MTDESIEAKFTSVLNAVRDRLKPLGFGKRGTKFTRLDPEVFQIVSFQRSQGNDKQNVGFTINIAVVSLSLAAAERGIEDATKLSEWDGHVRQRISSFSDQPADVWWTLNSDSDPTLIASEVVALLDRAIALLENLRSDHDLLRLWESGKPPGITAHQLKRYRSVLLPTSE